MKKLSFGKILSGWFVAAVILFLVNSLTLKSSIAHSFILSLLGITLFIYPAYPDLLENKYDKEKCKIIMRVIAAVQVILSFFVQTHF
ncbi:MAG: hypothetical protein NC400_06160 [Clostridium sp.]|nr:hypothetical protein [Clostridium sp.]